MKFFCIDETITIRTIVWAENEKRASSIARRPSYADKLGRGIFINDKEIIKKMTRKQVACLHPQGSVLTEYGYEWTKDLRPGGK